MSVQRAKTSDTFSLIRLSFTNPLYASEAMDLTLALDDGARNDERALLNALWLRTNGFEIHKTTALLDRFTRFPVKEPDIVTSRLIDDYALRTAATLDNSLHAYLLSHYHVPDSLPLVESLLERYRVERPLSNFILVACQHLLGTTVSQFEYFHRLGIAWKDMHIVGKPYSTSRAAMLHLQDRGANVHPFSQHFVSAGAKNSVWFETGLRAAGAEMLTDAHESLRGRGGRILILDDGGIVLDVANSLRDIDAEKIVGVEQTTGGINRLHSMPLRIPIVDVASSHAKLSLEARYIADSIITESQIHRARLRGTDADPEREHYLVVGFGPVGAGVAAMLQSTMGRDRVYVWDIDTRKAAVARQVGFNTIRDISTGLKLASCVIGCTGHRAFDSIRDSSVRPDTILISGSSANFEFDGIAARSRSRFTDLDESPYYQVARSDFARVHDDYRVTNDLGDFWLCNAGFPVNFTGDFDPIDAHHIQVTRALMIAGAVQASSARAEVGLRKFSEEFDACISDVFTHVVSG